ncbi:MAG: hypothetical protein KJ072_01285 [Verrucomicrobia bacterium]|nr:hypothetical protein [Verrucomicrobiota bacterium]
MGSESPQSESAARNAAQFATTHWSLVLAAGESASAESQGALEKLCRQYWFPLYAFVRGKGYSPEDAQDLTQGFCAYLLERHLLRKACADRGRFRSFLLGCLKNYLAQQQDRDQAQKRGGQAMVSSLEAVQGESWLASEMATFETPDALFERKWAMTVLNAAVKALETEYERAGKRALFEVLYPHVTDFGDGSGYATLEAELNMTRGAIRIAIFRLRKRCRELLRCEVAHTVGDPLEVEDELRQLVRVLSR